MVRYYFVFMQLLLKYFSINALKKLLSTHKPERNSRLSGRIEATGEPYKILLKTQKNHIYGFF